MSDKDSVIIEFKETMNNLSKAYKQFIATGTIDKDLLENARERIQVISIATDPIAIKAKHTLIPRLSIINVNLKEKRIKVY